MNILVLTSAYPQPDDNGYKTTPTVKYFCQEWAKSGHNVIVVHNNSSFPKLLYHMPRFIKSKIENRTQIQFPSIDSLYDICRVESNVKIYRKSMQKTLPHHRFSRRAIRKQGQYILSILSENNFSPDVVIGHWANPQLELISWLKNHYFGSFKTCIVFHNDCNISDVKRYKIRHFIKDIDVIGCRNHEYCMQVQSRLKLKKEPFICYSGIDTSAIVIKNTKEKQPNTIIYVGRLQRYKNVDSIIRAMSEIKEHTFQLRVYGSGTEKDALINLSKQLNIDNRVFFNSDVPHSTVFDKMSENEIFAMVSENEVFGMVYLEAMYMGCITIASKGCAVDGIIKDGYNGYLCESGNYKQLSDILRRISTMSDDQKNKISINAHNSASKFTNANVASLYLQNIMGADYEIK